MHTATLPKDWVTANVVPVFKRNYRSVVKNYRPISLTSLVIKTMERMIYSSTVSVLESHRKINHHQFGFRKGCSTLIYCYKLCMIGQNHLILGGVLIVYC